jgi:hypothetical protein
VVADRSARRRALWGVVALAVLAVAAAGAVLWPLTDWLAAHDVGAAAGPSRGPRLQSAREADRTQLLTLGAGIFAAGALVYTVRSFTLSRQAYQLTEQGQVTDRYTRAIDQLGSDRLDVRIGGIYALARIAHDSARDQPAVVEVLAAFIREHSREPWPPHESAGSAPGDRFPRPDVQAALTAIGRRDVSHDGWGYIDLTGAVLAGALLSHTNLTKVRLALADLTGANLVRANLTGANLTGAILAGAKLAEADLTGARRSAQDPVPDGWLRDPETGALVAQ